MKPLRGALGGNADVFGYFFEGNTSSLRNFLERALEQQLYDRAERSR